MDRFNEILFNEFESDEDEDQWFLNKVKNMILP